MFYFILELYQYHVRWVCWPCKNWDVFSFQELCPDPCSMRPCIITLQHEVMVVDEWFNNAPHRLRTLFLCSQNGINKMHMCTLSVTYTCLYHNPTATTTGHSIINVDISKLHTHMTPYKLSAICPVWWKTSPKVPDVIECKHLPTQAGYDDKLQSGRDPDEHADELP